MNLSRAIESRDSPRDLCKMAEKGYGSYETISVHNPAKFFQSSHLCRCQKLTKEPGPGSGIIHKNAFILVRARVGDSLGTAII